MKVLFTSDWQLEAGRDLGHGEFGEGSRFADQQQILGRIAGLAIEENVDVVCVLGDLFEFGKPSPHAVITARAFFDSLRQAQIRSLVLQGNHDSRGNVLPSALGILNGNNCAVASQPALFPLADDLVVACLPWTPPGQIVAAMPDVARDDVNDAAAQALVAGAHVMLEQARIAYPDARVVLTGHWAISGAALPSGLDSSLLREPVVPLEALADSGYSLAAFGHIHKAQVLTSGPTPVFYCGSPQVNRWDEAEGEHGVWIYDSAGAGALRFVPVVDDRRFLTIDPELIDFGPGVGVGFAEPPGDVRNAVVRVRYTVTEALARKVDQAKIRNDLLSLGASKVIIRPTVIREERARVSTMSDDLSEVAALDLWLQTQMVDEALAKAMRNAHGNYLAAVRA